MLEPDAKPKSRAYVTSSGIRWSPPPSSPPAVLPSPAALPSPTPDIKSTGNQSATVVPRQSSSIRIIVLNRPSRSATYPGSQRPKQEPALKMATRWYASGGLVARVASANEVRYAIGTNRPASMKKVPAVVRAKGGERRMERSGLTVCLSRGLVFLFVFVFVFVFDFDFVFVFDGFDGFDGFDVGVFGGFLIRVGWRYAVTVSSVVRWGFFPSGSVFLFVSLTLTPKSTSTLSLSLTLSLTLSSTSASTPSSTTS